MLNGADRPSFLDRLRLVVVFNWPWPRSCSLLGSHLLHGYFENCSPAGPVLNDHSGQDTGHAVGDVVVRTRRVIDRVPATARGAAFQRAELCYKLRMVEQFGPSAVQ